MDGVFIEKIEVLVYGKHKLELINDILLFKDKFSKSS